MYARLILLLICLLWQSQSVATNPAGIVMYMTTADEVYLLLADHRGSSRGWGAFGGGAENGENRMETAARETEEETRGFFKKEELLKKLEGRKPFIDGKFHMYFLEIDFVSAQRITNNELPERKKPYKERGPYAWIPYSELKKYLIGKTGEKTYYIDKRYLPKRAKRDYFWKVWVSNMVEAYKSKSIPWEHNFQ